MEYPEHVHIREHVYWSRRRELFVRVSNHGRRESGHARGDAGIQEGLGGICERKDGAIETRAASPLFQSELFLPFKHIDLVL